MMRLLLLRGVCDGVFSGATWRPRMSSLGPLLLAIYEAQKVEQQP